MRRGRVIFISDNALIKETQNKIEMAVLQKHPENIDKLRNEFFAKHPINHLTLQVLFLHACYSGNIKDAYWFLNKGLDPNQVSLHQLQSNYNLTNKIPATPLLLACMGSHENVIQLLLSKLSFDSIKQAICNYMELYTVFSVGILQIIFNFIDDPNKILLAKELLPNTCSIQQLQILINNGAEVTQDLLGKIYIYQSVETVEQILKNFPQLSFQNTTVKAALNKEDPFAHIAKYYNTDALDETKVLTLFDLLKKHSFIFKIDNDRNKEIFLNKIALTKNNVEANRNSLKIINFLETNGVSFTNILHLPLAYKYFLSKLCFLCFIFKQTDNIFSKLPADLLVNHILPYMTPIEFHTNDAKLKKPASSSQISLQKPTQSFSFKPVLKPKSSTPTQEPYNADQLLPIIVKNAPTLAL